MLLAEDNPDDALLMKRAYNRAELTSSLIHVEDGVAAIEYLQRCLTGLTDCPQLIVLDIKMPKRDGFEVLAWVRSNPAFSATPIVILSNSNHHTDAERAIQEGATDFQTKPFSVSKLVELLKIFEARWLPERG